MAQFGRCLPLAVAISISVACETFTRRERRRRTFHVGSPRRDNTKQFAGKRVCARQRRRPKIVDVWLIQRSEDDATISVVGWSARTQRPIVFRPTIDEVHPLNMYAYQLLAETLHSLTESHLEHYFTAFAFDALRLCAANPEIACEVQSVFPGLIGSARCVRTGRAQSNACLGGGGGAVASLHDEWQSGFMIGWMFKLLLIEFMTVWKWRDTKNNITIM